MITTTNNHGETVELTFIRMTDDGMHVFQDNENTVHYLEKGDFVDSNEQPEEDTDALRSLKFTLEISGRNIEVSVFLTVCTHYHLSGLLNKSKSMTLKQFNSHLQAGYVKALIKTKYEAALIGGHVMDKIHELIKQDPRLANWY